MRIDSKYFLLLLAVVQLSGCSLGYYWQAMSGHLELMRQRRPVVEVIADSATPESVRAQLQRAQRVLDFAHTDLLLPSNGSYETYADTGRDFVVWNVFAADEFSVTPRTWCFPVAGCVSYRGYFSVDAAERFAAQLSGKGLDTYLGGVAAYSTLGRFRDPLLNNMMALPDYRIVGLLIHELAHQKLYVKDDSSFNESFASFVEQAGVSQWLRREGNHQSICDYRGFVARLEAVRRLLVTARERLENLYASDLPAVDMRNRKARVFAELNADYAHLRAAWPGPPYFDGWFGAEMNNARMVALSTYDRYVPAFRTLFAQSGQDWADFYPRVAELAALPPEQRAVNLESLAALGESSESAAADPGFRGECRESAGSGPWPLPAVLRRS